jgi:glycerophosphoryl diester phosphodiesterase
MSRSHELRFYGHRGACIERPENTMPSFRRALELGVDVIETDVHATRDGHIVVSHDDDGMRAAGVRRWIRDCTLAEVQSWDAAATFADAHGQQTYLGHGLHIPTLAEVLEAFPDTRFNIDIKQPAPSIVGDVVALLRSHRAEQRTTLASFSDETMGEVLASDFGGQTVLARNEVVAVALLPPRLLRRRRLAGRAIQLPLRAGPLEFSSRSFIERCHRLGLRVDFWTVNDPDVAGTLLGRGADGIMTDDPAGIAPVFERARSRAA